MNRGTFFYALWCITVVLTFAASVQYGFSPFADGGRTSFTSGGGHGGVYVHSTGPHHK